MVYEESMESREPAEQSIGAVVCCFDLSSKYSLSSSLDFSSAFAFAIENCEVYHNLKKIELCHRVFQQ